MCMTKTELEAKVQEIRKYKAMAEEASNIQKALENEVIEYMKKMKLIQKLQIQQRLLIRNNQEQHSTKQS